MRDLPAAFAGDPSIVIVAFERHQQADVDSWLPWLAGLRERLPGLEVYELPAIKRRWLPFRGFIDGGMRSGIPDPETRRRTLTAYTDIGSLNRALRIDSTTTIALFVVSRNGSVAWSGRAAYDPDAATGLERAATAARNDADRSEAVRGSEQMTDSASLSSGAQYHRLRVWNASAERLAASGE